MHVRPLGTDGPDVPVVIFGAWAIGGWWWGGSDDAQAVESLQAGLANGVTAIDTAPMYGCGHSERVVGRALRDAPDAMVLTKVGLRWDCAEGAHFFDTQHPTTGAPLSVMRNLRPESVLLEVERSRERLGRDVLDLVQCHWPDPSTPIEETMGALADLVNAGVVRHVGVSNFDVDLLERAQAALATRGLSLASHQPRYSLLDRSIEATTLPWCHAHGVGVLAYSPLAQGLLTGKVTPDRVFSKGDGRRDHPLFAPESRRAIAAACALAAPIAAEHGCTLAQLSLAWVLHQPGMTAVLAGARSSEQVRDNAGAADVVVDADALARLAQIFDGLGQV